MMDFDEFKEKVKDNIKNYLPMQYEKANVSLQSVVKNNDVQLTGLMIRLEEFMKLSFCLWMIMLIKMS